MSSLPTLPENSSGKIVQQWLAQGEAIYSGLVKECQALEAQLEEIETRLAAKHTEVNQVAQIIGKPPLEGNRRLSAQLVTSYAQESQAPHRNPIPPRMVNRPPREPVAREVVPPRT